VPLLINEGSFSKASAPPLFLENENIFQKSASVVPGYHGEFNSPWYHGGRFLKNVLIFEKKKGMRKGHGKGGGADFFPGFVWWVVDLWAESPIQI
jgi:hypothetical protein